MKPKVFGFNPTDVPQPTPRNRAPMPTELRHQEGHCVNKPKSEITASRSRLMNLAETHTHNNETRVFAGALGATLFRCIAMTQWQQVTHTNLLSSSPSNFSPEQFLCSINNSWPIFFCVPSAILLKFHNR